MKDVWEDQDELNITISLARCEDELAESVWWPSARETAPGIPTPSHNSNDMEPYNNHGVPPKPKRTANSGPTNTSLSKRPALASNNEFENLWGANERANENMDE